MNWYPKEKIHFAKLKLQGVHPGFLTVEEFKLNGYVLSHIKKDRTLMPAVTLKLVDCADTKRRYTVEEQVDLLIKQATSPHVLGRVFAGWEPFV